MFPTRKVSARDLPGYLVNLLLQEACLAVVEGDPDRLLHCGIRLKLGRVTQVHVDTDRAFNTAQRGGIEIREVSDAEEAAFIAARNAGKDSES